MTPQEFDNLLLKTKTELIDVLKHGKVEGFDIYTKAILDHQEIIARGLFNNFNATLVSIERLRTDIRERDIKLMEKLKEIEAKIK